MSLLGYEIDALIHKYKIIFTISAGNHNLWQFTDDYANISDDDDAIIASPLWLTSETVPSPELGA